MSIKTAEEAKRDAQQKREADEKVVLEKKEADLKSKQETERKKAADEKIKKDSAKAAEKAAVKASKSKKKSSWMPSRRTLIISALVAVGAIGYKYYQSLPDSRRVAAAEQAFVRGNFFYEQGDLTSAIHSYQLAVAGNPQHADAWCNLGNAYSSIWQTRSHEHGILQQAVFSYKKAIEVNSRHVDAHFNLGVLFHTLEKVELAIPEYQTAIQLEPKHYDAYSNLGSAKHKLQDLDGAIDAYQKAIDILRAMDQQTVDQNQLSMLYYLLGTALSGLPDHRCQDGPCLEHAANKLRQSLQHNPDNEEARHALSALVSDPNVTSASAKYIRSLFDEYAANFDNSLLKGLDYQAPELVFATVDRLRAKARVAQFGTVYDAGCGTGLCGPLFRNVSKTLIGVDLSEPMVEKARERGVYDELEAADISESLQRFHNKSDSANFRRLDLIVAADVFVYTGDMQGVVQAAAGALRRGGWFALTLERLEAPKAEADPAAAAAEEDANATRGAGHAVTEADLARGWKLQLSGRFAHTKEYVTALGQQHGFKVLEHEHIVPRKDNGVDIPGHLFVLELTR